MSDSPKMILSPNNEFKDNSDDSGAQSSVAIQNKLVQPRSLEEDQDQLNSKQCRLEYFRNGVDADCEVHVPRNGDNGSKALENVCYKKFRCHRVFLATASEKLEHDVLLNNQWNGILQISGVSPESVEIFLEFIYTFEVTSTIINLKIIGDIFVLSCAYQLPELLSIFSQKLKDIEFPLEDIFPTYDLAFRNSMLDLENACLEVSKDLSKFIKSLNIFLFIENYNQCSRAEIPAKSYWTATLRLQLRHSTLVSDPGTYTYICALLPIKYMYIYILFIGFV